MTAPGVWRPTAARIVEMFEAMAEMKPPVLELAWKNPGRWPLQEQQPEEEITEEKEAKLEASTDHMDFDDGDDDTVQAFSRKTSGTPIGSAQKKTISFQETLDNMRRHKTEEREFEEE